METLSENKDLLASNWIHNYKENISVPFLDYKYLHMLVLYPIRLKLYLLVLEYSNLVHYFLSQTLQKENKHFDC